MSEGKRHCHGNAAKKIEQWCALTVLLGGGGGVGFEHALEVALVGKAQVVGDVAEAVLVAQALTGLLDAAIELVGMGSPACAGLEQAHKVKAAEVQALRHLGNAQFQEIRVLQQAVDVGLVWADRAVVLPIRRGQLRQQVLPMLLLFAGGAIAAQQVVEGTKILVNPCIAPHASGLQYRNGL